MDKVSCYLYENQLTPYMEYQDVLLADLTPRMEQMRERYAVQGWKDILTAEELAREAINEFILIKVGAGWLGFSVVCPWFLDQHVLVEELMLDVPLPLAVEVLKTAAKRHGCKRLTVGTRVAPNGKHLGLMKSYQRQGLSIGAIELTLEV